MAGVTKGHWRYGTLTAARKIFLGGKTVSFYWFTTPENSKYYIILRVTLKLFNVLVVLGIYEYKTIFNRQSLIIKIGRYIFKHNKSLYIYKLLNHYKRVGIY